MRTEVLKLHARQMRKEPTPAEKRLWALLRNRRFAEFKFRRQQPVDPYIADFLCFDSRVIVELDGETHVGNEAKDARRHKWLEAQGFKVIRVWNTELYENANGLLQAIWNACNERKPPLAPGGRGRTRPKGVPGQGEGGK